MSLETAGLTGLCVIENVVLQANLLPVESCGEDINTENGRLKTDTQGKIKPVDATRDECRNHPSDEAIAKSRRRRAIGKVSRHIPENQTLTESPLKPLYPLFPPLQVPRCRHFSKHFCSSSLTILPFLFPAIKHATPTVLKSAKKWALTIKNSTWRLQVRRARRLHSLTPPKIIIYTHTTMHLVAESVVLIQLRPPISRRPRTSRLPILK